MQNTESSAQSSTQESLQTPQTTQQNSAPTNPQSAQNVQNSATAPVSFETRSNATWMSLEEFLKLSGLPQEKVFSLIESKNILSKKEGDKILIDATSGTSALVKRVEYSLLSSDTSGNALDPLFVEKTISTILSLHEKVVAGKDETISAYKNENSFLKEALVSMQEVYDDDKKTMETLRSELERAREENEFMKRKYRLMWGRISDMSGK